MADDLKRVGLVFKDDGSTDFIKSIKLVNAELKENYQQFKLTQEQWDKSTTVTQKLRDKITYLNGAYDIQKDKVTTLKKQLEELENEENRNEVAIAQKRAELASAETALQRYEKQIKATTNELKSGAAAIKDFGEYLQNSGKEITEVGKKVSAFSAASAAALGASLKSAIDFEDAFIGVTKTVDGTDEQINKLRKDIRDMAKEIPASTKEIAGVAEAAGQLGIETDNVMAFTRTMIDMGNATNLSAETAATTLARFANVTQMSQKDFDKLGSTIVALGNNFATTEAEIAAMGMNLGSAGKQVGMTQAEIMALATALSSVGLEAQAGGTAFSKVMIAMQLAVEKGGSDLKDFAKVAGMTTKDFQKAFKEDATSAIMAFIDGLSKSNERGKSAIKVLDDMGITETRLRDALLRSSNASDIFSKAIQLGTKSWEENSALTTEAEKRYAGLKSQMTMLGNKLQDVGITVGEKLFPAVKKIIEQASDWIAKVDKLDDKQIETIVTIGLFTAALGPALIIVGNMVSSLGNLITTFGNLVKFINANPVVLAITLIAGAFALITAAVNKTDNEVRTKFELMGKSASDFIDGISKATSHLDDFNHTFFASSEEIQRLQQNMNEVQAGITEIARKASEERREYTNKEIVQLDEYFKKLREIKDRQLEIEKQIAEAIQQQAVMIAETHKGSLEEYKVVAQEWIKTAKDQKEMQIGLIEQGTTEEIALLNLRYGEKANMENEAYAKEFTTIMTQKEERIAQANEEVSKINEAYANGYTQRAIQDEEFFTKFQENKSKIETEEEKHRAKIDYINNNKILDSVAKGNMLRQEETRHEKEQQKIWNNMYKNMSDSQIEQLGSWLGMVSNAEVNGAKIDKKTKEMVDNVLSSFNSMPPKTRETMQQAMQPMFDEMQRTEPGLFSKATGIANGIVNRLRKAFDIHSPSRKIRNIFRNVMSAAEIEIDEGTERINKQTDNLSNQFLEDLNGMSADVNVNTNSKGKSGILTAFIEALKTCSFIDYERLEKAFSNALTNAKFSIDEEGFVRIIKDELYEIF